eukprot:5938089-Amphidinium_carterae.1
MLFQQLSDDRADVCPALSALELFPVELCTDCTAVFSSIIGTACIVSGLIRSAVLQVVVVLLLVLVVGCVGLLLLELALQVLQSDLCIAVVVVSVVSRRFLLHVVVCMLLLDVLLLVVP